MPDISPQLFVEKLVNSWLLPAFLASIDGIFDYFFELINAKKSLIQSTIYRLEKMKMIQISKRTEQRFPQMLLTKVLLVSSALMLVGSTISNASSPDKSQANNDQLPANSFDLSHWKLTLPIDRDLDGKVANVSTAELQDYVHDDFFKLDEHGHLVFTAPNRGGTTVNSSNTRSELRYMSRGSDQSIGTHDPRNNLSLIHI